MSIDVLKGHLAEFARSISLSGAELDAEGYCALGFDGMIIHLQHDAEVDAVVAFSALGALADDRREEMLAELLGANFFWQGAKGATLALAPDTDNIFIQASFQCRVADDAGFIKWLGDFVDVTDYWTRRIQSLNGGAAVEAPASDDRPADGAIQFFA